MQRMTSKEYIAQIKKKKNKHGVSLKIERTWSGFWNGIKQEIVFQSKREMQVWAELLMQLKAGYISQLSRQVPVIVGTDPKTIYIMDFVYYDFNVDGFIYLEVKGHETQTWKRKAKLFKQKYPNVLFKVVK